MTNHEDDFLDRLGEMFELQGNLQRETYGSHPSDIVDGIKGTYPERIAFIKDMKLALESELQEFLDETGWKPWATSRHINFEAAQGELVDAFHFFMNLCMAVDMTPDMLYERYKAKRLKNIKRQQDGYDGITGKCPSCKRALDDDAVECQVVYFNDQGLRLKPGLTSNHSKIWCAVESGYVS